MAIDNTQQITKLIPMTEFVIHHCNTKTARLSKFYNYAKFLRQDLEKWMFIGEEALFEGWHVIGEGMEDGSKVAEIEMIGQNAWINFIDDKSYITYRGYEEYEVESIEQIINDFSLDLTLTQKAKDIIYGNN